MTSPSIFWLFSFYVLEIEYFCCSSIEHFGLSLFRNGAGISLPLAPRHVSAIKMSTDPVNLLYQLQPICKYDHTKNATKRASIH